MIDFLAKNWIFKVLNMRTLFLRYTVPFRIQCWIRICKKKYVFPYENSKIFADQVWLWKNLSFKIGGPQKWLDILLNFLFHMVNMEVDWFHACGFFLFLTETQDNGEKLLKNGQNKAYFWSVGPHLIQGLDNFFLAFSQSHILILKCLNGFFEFWLLSRKNL